MHEFDSYPSSLAVTVQWGDMDALGHVNNTVPIRWLESSRIDYMEISGMAATLQRIGIGPILAAVNCSYKRQLRYPDKVTVGCRVVSIGRSSLTFQHVVFSEHQNAIAAEGESVVVAFDYESQRPVRIPDDVREQLQGFQSDLSSS